MADRCSTCPLYLQKHNYVPGVGPSDSPCVIGEAPGSNEVMRKTPFVGASGKLLRDAFGVFKTNPSKLYITNVVACRPIDNETPDTETVQACRPRLIEELKRVRPTKILTVGAVALQSILNLSRKPPITKQRGLGMMVELEPGWNVYVVPTLHPSGVLRDPDLFRDFMFDINKWLTTERPKEPPQFDVLVPRTPEEALEQLTHLFTKYDIVSCDLETHGFNPISDSIYTIGFGVLRKDGTGLCVVVPIEIAEDPRIKAVLDAVFNGVWEGEMVYHNYKFDGQFLTVWLGHALHPYFITDTILLKYAADERGGGEDRAVYRTLGLKEMARTRYDIPDYHFDFDLFAKTPNSMKNWDLFYRYNAQDCYLTLLIRRDVGNELDEESPKLREMVNGVLVPLTKALVDVELHGALMDVEYLEAQKELFVFDIAHYAEQLQQVACELGWKGTKTWVKEQEAAKKRFEKAGQVYIDRPPEFNANSPMQVKTMVFEVLGLKTRNGTTERDDLQGLLNSLKKDDDRWDFVNLLMEVRLRSHILSTYIQGILTRVDTDNRVRTTFNLTRTDTGRLSSNDPNLQNIPSEDVNKEIGKRVKRAFIVPEGYTMIEADYSQIELRVAAWLSQDPIMMKAFQEKRDIHTTVAMMIFHLPADKITKALRYVAKFVDFPVIYGRTPNSLVNGWENDIYETLSGKRWDVKEVQGFFDSFLNEFKGLARWIRNQQAQVLKLGYVEMPTGRRRRFPLRIPRTYGEISRKAVNTPIQSTAGELTEMALARMRYSLPSYAHVFSTVHDSCMVEVRNDQLTETIKIMRYEMEENLHIKMNVPLVAEFKTGTNWAELTSWEG